VPYDFPQLVQACPALKRFLQAHPAGGETVDFADPEAVKTLNQALLYFHYGVVKWDIPAGCLCPPIPSRADYLHHAADLLAEGNVSDVPRGPAVAVLDIGMGANCIYPLIGARLYGWRFVGTDIDRAAVDWARRLVAGNPAHHGAIECRLQPKAEAIFAHVTRPPETFALSLCNPPFHDSPEAAAAGTLRKLKNLGGGEKPSKAVLNFGGRGNELWCPGGEVAFVKRMIIESAGRPDLCGWFTTLVSKQGSLPALHRELGRAHPTEVRTLALFAGQKQSRILAWTFLPKAERRRRLESSRG